MSPHEPESPPTRIRNFLRGLGEVVEFLRESALAIFEVATGHWPQPSGEEVRKPNPPNEGMGPLEKFAPFPTDD